MAKKREVFDEPMADDMDIDAEHEAARAAAAAPEPTEAVADSPPVTDAAPADAPPEVTAAAPAPTPTEAPPVETDSYEVKYNNLQKALRAERDEKAALAAQVQATQQQLAQLAPLRDELVKRQQEAQQKAQQEEFEANPAEYLRKQQEALAQRMDSYRQQQEQMTQQQALMQQFHQSVSAEAAEFAKRTPDYPDAFAFVRDRRMAEYAVLGVPPERAQALFDEESWGLAIQARQNNRSAPEMVMELAKVWGYQLKAGGAQPTATVTNLADKVRRMEAGVRASGTLSDGMPAEQTSTLKKIEAMTDAEFDEYWEKEVHPQRNY